MTSDTSISYARGVLDGVQKSTWVCGDCGNTYDAAVQYCPNVALDHAYVLVRLAETLAAKDDAPAGTAQAPSPTPHNPTMAPDPKDPSGTGKHDPKCACAQGSCCSWISNCTCQCMCDVIADIRADERATTPHPSIEVDTRVRSTYLRLNDSPVARTTGATPRVLVDLDVSGNPVGIELIGIAL